MFSEHEIRWLYSFVAFLLEELFAVHRQSIVEEKTVAGKAVASMSSDFLRSFWVIAIDPRQNFMVGETFSLLQGDSIWRPASN